MRRVFSEIERRRQEEELGYSPDHDATHSCWEWAALLTRHVGLAVDDGLAPNDRFRKQMVRVAALAVAALEAHDRARPPLAAGPPWWEVQGRKMANDRGEPVLWVECPPPGREFQSHIPYLVPLSQANAAERAGGVRYDPEGGRP